MLIVLLFTWACLLAAVYVYLGYPLLLILIGQFIKNPIKRGEHTPHVSLIIAAYNERDVIGPKIENSFELDYPKEKLEIMVVSDGSSDDTPQIAESYTDRGVVSLFSPERRGKSAALNRGVAQAKGDILVFSDANAYYDPMTIRYLVENFYDPEVGCVSGKKTVIKGADSAIGESEGIYWKYESFLKKQESQIHSTTGVVGEMNALRRELYEPIPSHIINDDAYLAFRIMQGDKRVIYEPRAFSYETPAFSTRDEIIRRQRINAGRYQLFFAPSKLWPWNNLLVLFKLFSHKFMRLLLPFFMFGAFIGNGALLFFSDVPPLMILIFLAQLAFYGLAVVGWQTERNGMKLKIPRLAYFLVSTNYAAYQGFLRFMRGKQSVLWEKATRAKENPSG